MKRRWIVLAILFGATAFAATLFWPARPVWRATLPSLGEPLCFTGDGRELLAVTGATYRSPSAVTGEPTLYRFDAATGQRVVAPKVFASDSIRPPHLIPAPDGQKLVISAIVSGGLLPQSFHPIEMRSYKLYDVADGSAVHLRGTYSSDPFGAIIFSPDSRWVCTFSPILPRERCDHVDIHDGRTGTHVLGVRVPNPGLPLSCCFAPDGSAFALLRLPDKATVATVEIQALPSGQRRKRWDLPTNFKNQRLVEWSANRLYVETQSPDGTHRTVSYDLDAAEIGEGREEPDRARFSDPTQGRLRLSGPGWVAHCDYGPSAPSWLRRVQKWLADRTQLAGLKPTGNAQLTFYDEGQPRRGRLPRRPEFPIVSRDGRRVGSASEQTISVWDADPPPRWPWALPAGFGAMVPPLLVGRWRAKR